MKARIYKKLCKKSAEFCRDGVNKEEGIHYVYFYCSYDDGGDTEDCWPWLTGLFDGDVNTVIDEDSECGLSWVRESQRVRSTPRNVFAWARNQKTL